MAIVIHRSAFGFDTPLAFKLLYLIMSMSITSYWCKMNKIVPPAKLDHLVTIVSAQIMNVKLRFCPVTRFVKGFCMWRCFSQEWVLIYILLFRSHASLTLQDSANWFVFCQCVEQIFLMKEEKKKVNGCKINYTFWTNEYWFVKCKMWVVVFCFETELEWPVHHALVSSCLTA